MILVTGSNGFLGSEIVKQLIKDEIQIRGTDIQNYSINSEIEYIKADLIFPEQLINITKDISTVIHVAGLAHVFNSSSKFHHQFYLINEKGTHNIISAAGKNNVRHFILISTVSVYGQFTKGVYDEDTPPNPVGPYAKSKYNAEKRAKEIAKKNSMSLTILRLATLYGEGDPGNIRRLIRTIYKRRFFWIGDGSNRKSLLYKEDAAIACLAAMKNPRPGASIYNVSSSSCTMRQIVNILCKLLKKRPLPLKIPESVAIALSKFLSLIPYRRISSLNKTVEKFLAEDIYDTSLFEKDYNFYTKIDLYEGLEREVNWYRRNLIP